MSDFVLFVYLASVFSHGWTLTISILITHCINNTLFLAISVAILLPLHVSLIHQSSWLMVEIEFVLYHFSLANWLWTYFMTALCQQVNYFLDQLPRFFLYSHFYWSDQYEEEKKENWRKWEELHKNEERLRKCSDLAHTGVRGWPATALDPTELWENNEITRWQVANYFFNRNSHYIFSQNERVTTKKKKNGHTLALLYILVVESSVGVSNLIIDIQS